MRHQDPPHTVYEISYVHNYYNCFDFNGCHEYTCAYIGQTPLENISQLCYIYAYITTFLILLLHPI